MLSWFIERKITAFEAEYGYDATYMREMLATDPAGLMAFAKAQDALKGYRKDVSDDVYYAATLASCLIGDCGPCTQLVVTMALRQGVPRQVLENVVRGNDAALDEDVRLAVRFVRASLARVPEADGYRQQVVERWGRRALISLTFALLVAQIYPIVKYALGHGQTCQRIEFGEDTEADSIAVPAQKVA